MNSTKFYTSSVPSARNYDEDHSDSRTDSRNFSTLLSSQSGQHRDESRYAGHSQENTVTKDYSFSSDNYEANPRNGVLLVSANPQTRSTMRNVLEQEGYSVREAAWSEQVIAHVGNDISVILIDSGTKDGQTAALCKFIASRFPEIPIVVMDDPANDLEQRRAIIKHSTSYLTKPCDRVQLMSCLSQAVKTYKYQKENQALKQLIGLPTLPMSINGTSLAVQTLCKQIEAFGRLDSTVLISGERGTGKNIIAQLIHQASARAKYPFFILSCNSIPSEIMEADMFGYVQNLMGEVQSERMGRLELMSHGTLYLDNVEALSPFHQAKLLTYLQDRTYRPIGSNETRTVDARIIASTRGGLAVACAKGRFREDLFFKLSSMTITVPPLRERIEDIQPLCRDIVIRLARQFGTNQPIVSTGAIHKLKQYSWPGNIYELEAVLQRAMELSKDSTIISEDDITFDPVACENMQGDGTMGLAGLTMADIERRAIIETIHACGGNRAQSAQKLGISEKTIYNKIKQFKLRGIV
ncbi:MAG: sigma-54-dependent transcriptional regulator [Thermoguttaceae bacterium]